MFSHAYEIAAQYTAPVIISTRTLDGSVQCGGGAFVYLNREGWILTAAHVFNARQQRAGDALFYERYRQEIRNIEARPDLPARSKEERIASIPRDPGWVINESYWWGMDGVTLEDVKIFDKNDLAIGRLEPFRPETVQQYPKIKDPSTLKPGTSLCKLGFPFHQIHAAYNKETNTFELAGDALPVPFFPMDGILTRFIHGGKADDGDYEIKFIETSTPGLMGQSGGPIFDRDATVWGIQSHTNHIPLGFSPKIARNGTEVEENQFINVGCGVHPETIVNVLLDNGIPFELG